MKVQVSKSLSVLRGISMLFIVLCHILQYYGNRYAFVFNVGVQIFLVLSGFLYGDRNIENWKSYFKGRFRKVLIPYYLVFIIITSIMFVVGRFGWLNSGIISNILCLQGISFTLGYPMIEGLRHLWFITAICICYLLLPALQYTKKYSDILLLCAIPAIYLGYNILSGPTMFFLSWLYLFAIGYWFANYKNQKLYGAICIVLATVLCFDSSWANILNYFDRNGRILHDLGGSIVIMLIINYLQGFFSKLYNPLAKALDKYSFDVYLIHYPLVFGPLSIISIFDNKILSLFVWAIIVIIASYLFHSLVTIINKRLYEN